MPEGGNFGALGKSLIEVELKIFIKFFKLPVGIFFTVIPGILIGALISKNIASFLEENDLFVPEDEDDD